MLSWTDPSVKWAIGANPSRGEGPLERKQPLTSNFANSEGFDLDISRDEIVQKALNSKSKCFNYLEPFQKEL